MARYDAQERFRYLQQLVTEFQTTNSSEAKEQVLANLANFAYDPVNYDHFRRLNIVRFFLDQLEDGSEETIKEFAVGGICNLAADPNFLGEVVNHGGLGKIIACLSSSREETVLSATTVLIHLVSGGAGTGTEDLRSQPVVDCMQQYADSSNRRLSNLAKIFLDEVRATDSTSTVGTRDVQ